MATSYDNLFKYYQNQLKGSLESANKSVNSQYDLQNKVVTDKYNSQIADTKAQYEDQLRTNAVQKLINQDQVAESMANMGLTDSGLNRTQQTAIQLSYANNNAKINMQRQKAVDSLAMELSSIVANNEINRNNALATNQQNYNNAVTSAAQNQYKIETDADIERAKMQNAYNLALEQARISANTELQKAAIENSGSGGDNFRLYEHIGEDLTGTKNTYKYTDNSGKEQTIDIEKGTNPYTGAKNLKSKSVVAHRTFSNGYQPRGIVTSNGTDYGKLSNSGLPAINVNGRDQTLWKTVTNGVTRYWYWVGSKNSYIQVKVDGNGNITAATGKDSVVMI